MDHRRKRNILILSVILIFVGIILRLWSKPRGVTVSVPDSESTARSSAATLPVSGDAPSQGSRVAIAPAAPAALAVQQLAMTFTERYGSYSAEGDFVNLEDLYSLMTERYLRSTETEVARWRATAPRRADGVVAVTTIVLHVGVRLSEGETSTVGSADVLTQRTAITSGGRPQTTTETLELDMRKTPDGWRVDGAKWKRAA